MTGCILGRAVLGHRRPSRRSFTALLHGGPSPRAFTAVLHGGPSPRSFTAVLHRGPSPRAFTPGPHGAPSLCFTVLHVLHCAPHGARPRRARSALARVRGSRGK